ncbi:MAG: glutamyl-tRNA reductase, partial [Acidimicrobiales bacterium]
AGLDSAVLGESEILRQVRAAADAARANGTTGPVLGALVRHALEAGKRVRTETGIARGTTSLSHTAVALAADPSQALCPGASAFADRACLVVGAGEMGSALVALLGAGSVRVANRSADRAARLGAEVVPWADLPRAVAESDVVFCATAAAVPVLDAAAVGPRSRPLVVVDLGVPRNVDPAVGELPGVTRYDLEDLKGRAEAAMAGRRSEIPRADAIVDRELERWKDAVAQRAVAAPVVAALRARAEALRAAEVQRLAGLDAAQRRAVDAATKRLVNKLLHDPSVVLNAAAGGQRGDRLAAALVELWGLDV